MVIPGLKFLSDDFNNSLSGAGDHARVLSQASALVNAFNVPVEVTLQTIVDTCINLLGADRGFVMICTAADKFEMKVGRSASGMTLNYSDFIISQSIAQQVIKTGLSVLVSDISEDEELSSRESITELGLGSAVAVPMTVSYGSSENPEHERRRIPFPVHNKMLGVLYLDSTAIREEYSEADVRLLEGMANLATAALINASLYVQATIDELTGTYIRRYFDQSLNEEIERKKSTDQPVSLILLDIDHFKKVNDKYGHLTGDMVLRKIGQIIRECIRGADICARYGGEEFAILLPGTDVQGGSIVAEKIRSRIESLTFDLEKLSITVSAGVADARDELCDQEMLVLRADQALYCAKESGRNWVVVWSQDFPTSASRTDTIAGILSGEPGRDSHYVRSLIDSMLEVTTTLDQETMIISVLDRMIDVTSADRAYLFERCGETNFEIRVGREHGQKNQPEAENVAFEVLCRVFEDGQIIHENDRGRSTPSDPPSASNQSALRSVIALPFVVKNHFQGAFYLDVHLSRKQFTIADRNFLEILTKQTGLTFKQAELFAGLKLENNFLKKLLDQQKSGTSDY